jgi:hypothetical protein
MTLHDYLNIRDACPDALTWLGDRSPREAWEVCERADWMLWLADHIGIDQRLVVLCGTGCARSVLHLLPAGEERPRQAIEAAEAWAYGRGTAEAAWRAARAAEAAWYAAWRRTRAADTAVRAAWAAEAAASTVIWWGTDAAMAATWAADAAEAAGAATRAVALRRYAHDIRSVIPWKHVADRLRAAEVEVGA